MAEKTPFSTEAYNYRTSTTDDNRYQNLNLNSSQKCSGINNVTVKSLSDVKEKPYGEQCDSRRWTYSDGSVWNSDERRSLRKVITSQSHINECNKRKIYEECASCDSTTHSTLSLHIAAYEAAVEIMYPDFDTSANKVGQTRSRLKSKISKKAETQKWFEFPRQQEDKIPVPELSQFSATQKLINPNNINYINDNIDNNEPATKRTKLNETVGDLPSTSKNPSSSSTPLPSPSSSMPSTSQKITTPKSSIIIISPSPLAATPKKRKYVAPAKPTVFDPMDMENYLDPDPEINKFVEQKRCEEAGIQITEPPKPAKTREEVLEEKFRESEKKRERLEAENAKMKEDLQKARRSISNKRYQENMKTKRKEEENVNDENKEDRDFEELPSSSRYHIINEIWDKLNRKYSPNMAAQIIGAVYNKKVEAEEKSLTPSQTLQVLKDSGISIGALRKIRSNLNKFDVPNPFASDKALNKERAKIHENVKFKKEKVMMSNTINGPKMETNVYYRESVLEELQERVDGTINAGNYEPFFVDGEEVIAAVLTNDKATDYSKLCMSIGNSKAPINSAHALSLLGYFKANDSAENVYAAYDRENGIGPQIDKIKEITVTFNGEQKTLKVKWFVVGDYKFLNAIAGLNSNSCSFPCWNCYQKPETTYADLDMNYTAANREMGIDENKSQIRDPLFKSIPFEYYIPPILHITLGPGAQLFEALCERARAMDSAGIQTKDVPEELTDDKARKKWETSYERIEQLKATLEKLNYQKSLYIEINEEPSVICASSTNCIASRDGINVTKIYERENFCCQCESYFHKCCLYKGQCPLCVKKHPSSKQCKDIIDEDLKIIEKEIKQTSKSLKDEENKIADIISKFKLGNMAKNVETVLEKYGGSRKVFFQSFTGKQLTKMGQSIREIYFDLDDNLQSDPEIRKIVSAIIKFFDIRKLLTTEILKDEDIDIIEAKIKDFGDYMKKHLPHFRVKQKGHTLFKHLVPFMRKFKIAAYFSDEAIEAFHVIFNRYDRRIGNRSPDKFAELMFYYNKEDTYIHDRFGYVEEEEE